jgi:hypothetical protein
MNAFEVKKKLRILLQPTNLLAAAGRSSSGTTLPVMEGVGAAGNRALVVLELERRRRPGASGAFGYRPGADDVKLGGTAWTAHRNCGC